jgi:hypothetical protein
MLAEQKTMSEAGCPEYRGVKANLPTIVRRWRPFPSLANRLDNEEPGSAPLRPFSPCCLDLGTQTIL